MTANYYLSLREIWERYHDKDIPEYIYDWQSWSKKEQPAKEEPNK